MKLSHKIFIISFCLSILPLYFVALHTTEQTFITLREREVNSAENNAGGAINDFTNELNRLKNLVRILAATRPAKSLPSESNSENITQLRKELSELFQTILEQNSSYDQIRLIGISDNAREIVRIDRGQNDIGSVPYVKLQSKGNRYYFKETISLDSGETFISHIDLNREFSEIEHPLKPVIRVATPVTTQEGLNVGIIIINVNFFDLLSNKVRPETPGEFLVTNENGDYLHNVDKNKTFAFEFGRQERIQIDYDFEKEWDEWINDSSAVKTKRFKASDHFLILSKVDGGLKKIQGEDRQWVYGFAIPRIAIEGIAKRLDEHLYISLIVIAASIAIASAYITSLVFKPLEDITSAANQIASGEQDVSIDVTGRGEIRILSHALQRMLVSFREAAKSQELAVLGRMVAMLAHDLRNSLSTVKMNMHILESEQKDDSLNDQWEFANNQILMMENVLADMLSFAKPERLNKEWHDPGYIAQTAILVMERHAHLKDVKITLDKADHLPRIKFDRTKILQVLQNLLDNALHFAPESSEVVVNVYFSDAEGTTANDINASPKIVYQISDEGPGISADIRDQLFDPFITKRPKGTGLGLAIVKKIVDQHEGEITFDDQNRKGAIFTITLPLGMSDANDQTVS